MSTHLRFQPLKVTNSQFNDGRKTGYNNLETGIHTNSSHERVQNKDLFEHAEINYRIQKDEKISNLNNLQQNDRKEQFEVHYIDDGDKGHY